MASALNICGVILAAGASSRMGRDKALLPWPPSVDAKANQTLLAASIDALKPFTHSVIVVAGRNFESLAPLATAHDASIVQNPEPERGQFSSLQVGLKELVARRFDAAMITLVDSPPLSSASMQKLFGAFDEARPRGMWGVQPENGGRHGHPLLATRALIDAFLAEPDTSNARTVKHQHAMLIESIPVPDPLLTIDMNTPEQYSALASTETQEPRYTSKKTGSAR
jgi:molybdenum cofactor cytidylyltransferase